MNSLSIAIIIIIMASWPPKYRGEKWLFMNSKKML